MEPASGACGKSSASYGEDWRPLMDDRPQRQICALRTVMNNIDSAKSRFRGHWRVDRHILDLDSEWLGRFRGEAWFRDDRGDLIYHEEGMLKFGGLTAIQATREYIWTFPSDNHVKVLFGDGSDFHDFNPWEQRPFARHFCDPDEYDVTYDFRKWPVWRAEWRVEGPKKDYRMVTTYQRPDAPKGK